VLPARLGSTRLHQKPLLKETGKYLIQHTYERAKTAPGAAGVVVATDDERVMKACAEFGAPAILTSRECASGTERVADVAKKRREAVIVNVQGDEPEIEPKEIFRVADLLRKDPKASIATLATPFRDAEEWRTIHRVKVLVDSQGYAIYFSRAAIPLGRDPQRAFLRASGLGIPLVGATTGSTEKKDKSKSKDKSAADGDGAAPKPKVPRGKMPVLLRHVGLYAYRRPALLQWKEWGPSVLAEAEDLEQLRALERGVKIRVGLTEYSGMGIDTRADYDEFVSKHRGAPVA
jgi:3-deoxy-manno-octulosonate cytidylyltransferase (CMP-KDO synthetase)